MNTEKHKKLKSQMDISSMTEMDYLENKKEAQWGWDRERCQ